MLKQAHNDSWIMLRNRHLMIHPKSYGEIGSPDLIPKHIIAKWWWWGTQQWFPRVIVPPNQEQYRITI